MERVAPGKIEEAKVFRIRMGCFSSVGIGKEVVLYVLNLIKHCYCPFLHDT